MRQNSTVTVVMYHYVRPVAGSAYPRMKGLELSHFSGQLDYLQKNYQPIAMEQLIEAVHHGGALPEKAVLLTFDDGYSDHYRFVLPVLQQKRLQGSFFPPAQAILEHRVLDVNKIHFVLACAPTVPALLKEISGQLARYRAQFNLPSDEALFRKLAIASDIDSKEIIFIKRLLQVELPAQARALITDNLFRKFVSTSEEEFSRDLYLNMGQIQEMSRAGMHIGCHGFSHEWLGTLPPTAQRTDIEKGLAFLAQTGADMKNWTLCYPFGSYNRDLISIIEEKDCKLAFISTPPDIITFPEPDRFRLPRVDTINIPVKG